MTKLRELAHHFVRPPGIGPAPWQVDASNRFTQEALARHKREGLDLAVRARMWCMATIAVFILFITPWPAVLYYEAAVLLFVLIGLAQRRVGTVGHNRWELVLLFCDLALMTIVCLVPNPFDDRSLPLAFQYRFETFLYFFTILAGATLAYSWQTIVAVGTWTALLWSLGAVAIWYFRGDPGEMQAAAHALYADEETLAYFMDPTALIPDLRVQEVVVFLIVAVTLAVSMRRFTNLVLAQAGVERERANLARYFSPNVVDQLSHNDEPLKQISTQDIAVLFVDIVGFTRFSATRAPEEVITTLRSFHALMEAEVFRHNGTLDKFLGDGLMATFGTPVAGPDDAGDALACARSMVEAVERWNKERVAAGEPEIRASFGIHYGPVVLGDIGANRLEFAVIGNTVNVASRLEAMTRDLGAQLLVSDALLNAATPAAHPTDLVRHDDRSVRGLDGTMTVWALS